VPIIRVYFSLRVSSSIKASAFVRAAFHPPSPVVLAGMIRDCDYSGRIAPTSRIDLW
jgi:hypothetical protein